jgi:hypothetical protein
MPQWIAACRMDEIEPEGARRFDHAGRAFAIHRSPNDEIFRAEGKSLPLASRRQLRRGRRRACSIAC